MRSLLIILTIFTFALKANASIIEIQAWVNPKEAPDIKKDQFIMVDFWATWCGPCIRAMDHLSELKKVSGDKVVYISLSKEPLEVVSQFFANRIPKTYIAIDYKEKTFEKFKIESLPFSILIAPDGQIIWQGNPSQMNFLKIENLIQAKKYQNNSVTSKIRTFKSEKNIVLKTDKKILSSDGIELTFSCIETPVSFNKVENFASVLISGSLSDIIADVLSVPKDEVQVEDTINLFGNISLNTIITEDNRYTIFNLLQKAFNVNANKENIGKNIFVMELVDSTMLWSKEMYEWNSDLSSSFLTWENNLQADNYTLKDFALLLSNNIGQSIYYNGNYQPKHDWNLSFENIESLQKQLKEEYGVNLRNEIISVPIIKLNRQAKQ